MTIRVGIIGTGRHGSRYANHIVNDLSALSLAAISRRSQEGQAQADAWGSTWYQDWTQLVAAEDVDAIIAVVPPTLNLDIAEACVAAGKPLLIEKPLAGNSIDAKKIVDLCSAHSLPLTVGQTLRYNGVVQMLRQHLADIGRLFHFSANQRLEPITLAWHEDIELAGAGVSYHTAVHVFDALRYITGLEITRVMAVTRSESHQRLENLLTVMVEMEDDVVGTVDCSKVSNSRTGRFEFVGQNGQLNGDQVHSTCDFIHGQNISVFDPGEPATTIMSLLKDWAGFLRGEQVNPVPGEEGLIAVNICEACLRSAAGDGVWQKIKPS